MKTINKELSGGEKKDYQMDIFFPLWWEYGLHIIMWLSLVP